PQRINGREYDLYYSGSNLHMVVLRDRGATYWVVNTLLNALSNETMLRIARGLRPRRREAPPRVCRGKAEDRDLRGRLGRPRHRGLLRRARPRGGRARRAPGADRLTEVGAGAAARAGAGRDARVPARA